MTRSTRWSTARAHELLHADDVPTRICGAFILWTRAITFGATAGLLLVGTILAVVVIVDAA